MLLLLLRSSASVVVPDVVIYEALACELLGSPAAVLEGEVMGCDMGPQIGSEISFPVYAAELLSAGWIAEIEIELEVA